jgi:hypothetical protein
VSVVTVIYGSHLIYAAPETDLNKDFVKKIDPEGWNVVTLFLPHDDAMTEIRAMMLFKLKDDPLPCEGSMTIRYPAWKRITAQIDSESLSKVDEDFAVNHGISYRD